VLFHDIHITAWENRDFANVVSDLNRKYFAGKQVIKMLNKPNFVL